MVGGFGLVGIEGKMVVCGVWVIGLVCGLGMLGGFVLEEGESGWVLWLGVASGGVEGMGMW